MMAFLTPEAQSNKVTQALLDACDWASRTFELDPLITVMEEFQRGNDDEPTRESWKRLRPMY
jgi:hypothetical protein